MNFAWATEKSFTKSNTVILGVPDETGSHAKRKGASLGPNRIRKISNERAIFTRNGNKSIVLPDFCKSVVKLHDAGNIKKKDVTKYISKVVKAGKMPITIGGDHSITFEVLKGLKDVGKVSVVYFDAHPDFVCSSRNYYGSVVCDVLELNHVDLKSSLEIGVRAIEKEEQLNIKRKRILTITPHEVMHMGIKKTVETIKKRVKKNKVYLSIDMDVIDPAFAPGVDTPVPGGFSSLEMLYFVKEISHMGLVGMDIMETSPPHDFKDFTSQLASRIIIEAISCMH